MKITKTLCILLTLLILIPVLSGCFDIFGDEEATAVITRSDSAAKLEASATEILREYISLRLAVDSIGERSGDKSEAAAFLSSTISGFEKLSEAADALAEVCGAENETSSASVINGSPYGVFSLKASAAESTKRAVDWAEEITKAYDSYPTGKQLRGLAQYLGTDCKTAMKKLEAAQNIMANEYENEADMWDDMADIATAIHITCKVELCVAGIGSTGITTLKDASLALINSVDTLVCVGSEGAGIVLGDKNNLTLYMNFLKNAFAPISSVTGLLTFNCADTSVADKITYIGDSFNDLVFDGKILGGLITTEKIKTTLKATLFDSEEEAEKEGFEITNSEMTDIISPENYAEIPETVVSSFGNLTADISSVLETLKELAESGFDPEPSSETVSKAEISSAGKSDKNDIPWPNNFYGVKIPAPEGHNFVCEYTVKDDAVTIRIDEVTWDEFVAYCKKLEALKGWEVIKGEGVSAFPPEQKKDGIVYFTGAYAGLERINVRFNGDDYRESQGIPSFSIFVFKEF